MAEDTGAAAAQGDEGAVAAAVAGQGAAAVEGGQQGAGEGASSTAWQYALGVPGSGDAPEWFKGGKYQTVEEQAKAYPELEKRFGTFTGSPDEFSVNLSQELTESGMEINNDDPLMVDALAFAKESNMNQEGFDKMMNLYGMAKMAESKAQEENLASELASLGDRGQARVDNLSAWANANLPPDLVEGFSDMAVSAKAIQAMERIVAMSRNAPMNPAEVKTASGVSAEEVKAMQFEEDDHGNRKIQTDPAFKAKFKKLSSEVWGSEEHRITVGR